MRFVRSLVRSFIRFVLRFIIVSRHSFTVDSAFLKEPEKQKVSAFKIRSDWMTIDNLTDGKLKLSINIQISTKPMMKM